MSKRRHVVTSLRLACLLAAACTSAPATTEFRVALVTPGSIADASWNSGAYAGLMQVKDSLGVPVSHVEARTPGEQEEQLRTYAAQGYTVIFGHGFEFQDAAERVAKEYPKAVFVITSGQRVNGNVVPLIFKLSDATYLAGMVAGSLTKSNKLGYVGGIELPPVKLAYDAWAAGARAMNPAVESRETYLNTFDDAVAGHEAALAMIRLGVDMLHHNADQSSLAPDRVVGSAVIDLPRAFLLISREVKEGRFTPRVESFGLESGVIKYVANPGLDSMVAPEVKAKVKAAEDSIIAGTLVPVDRSKGKMAQQ